MQWINRGSEPSDSSGYLNILIDSFDPWGMVMQLAGIRILIIRPSQLALVAGPLHVSRLIYPRKFQRYPFQASPDAMFISVDVHIPMSHAFLAGGFIF